VNLETEMRCLLVDDKASHHQPRQAREELPYPEQRGHAAAEVSAIAWRSTIRSA